MPHIPIVSKQQDAPKDALLLVLFRYLAERLAPDCRSFGGNLVRAHIGDVSHVLSQVSSCCGMLKGASM